MVNSRAWLAEAIATFEMISMEPFNKIVIELSRACFSTNCIRSFLIPEGLHIFSFPNLHEWLSRKYLNCLSFEHTIFLQKFM